MEEMHGGFVKFPLLQPENINAVDFLLVEQPTTTRTNPGRTFLYTFVVLSHQRCQLIQLQLPQFLYVWKFSSSRYRILLNDKEDIPPRSILIHVDVHNIVASKASFLLIKPY
ncbi:unnamed protein product [Orchesella dallaii]|uniref:Uncharacterized protein n=1 Tax=Orchesella dallaii TaxID=48710 RepID=A0ABP1S1M8_9HEXA